MKWRIEKITTETARNTGTSIRTRRISQDNMPVLPPVLPRLFLHLQVQEGRRAEGEASIFSGRAMRSLL
jgi:hypothetical protein